MKFALDACKNLRFNNCKISNFGNQKNRNFFLRAVLRRGANWLDNARFCAINLKNKNKPIFLHGKLFKAQFFKKTRGRLGCRRVCKPGLRAEAQAH
ncbi:MAG: hypothetical protein IKO42_05185 [Opitutales bacterium]|nr:hypothetical protein [Opitutales bacterium]